MNKIVIIGAAGKVGYAVAAMLAEHLAQTPGAGFAIGLATRRRKDGVNRSRLIARELLHAYAAGHPANDAAGLGRALHEDHHDTYDADDPDSLLPVLKGAGVVAYTAGVPLASVSQASADPDLTRSSLLQANAAPAEAVARAVARSAAPGGAIPPIITCTNPLDNIVTLMERACREEAGRDAGPSRVRIAGMAGTLDEARLHVAVAEALGRAGVDVRPHDVAGKVYGQHGSRMVIDTGSITVGADTLQEFAARHGLTNRLPELIREIKAATVGTGIESVKYLGRSPYIPTARKTADMLLAALGCAAKGGSEFTASAVRDWPPGSGGDAVAFGGPVAITPQGIRLLDFPKHIKEGSDIFAEITASRDAVRADQRRLGKTAAA